MAALTPAAADEIPLDGVPPFVEAVTLNRGATNETLERLRLSPGLQERIRDRRAIAPLVRAALGPLAQIGLGAITDDEVAELDDLSAEGWAWFSFVFGYESGVLTLAENLGDMAGLQHINENMSTLGLLMTAWQITLDLSNNDDRAAALNGYQGVIGWQLARLGTGPIQIANVGVFLMNAALQSFGREAWLAREDSWRQAYTAYYTDAEAAAEAAEFGAQPVLTPTLDERVAAIRAQTAGGRSTNDWITLFWSYHRNAVNRAACSAVVEREVDAYVARFWDDPLAESYWGATGQAGLAQGAGLTAEIRANLENEHRAALYRRFARDVFPEVAALAAVQDISDALPDLNEALRPDLNAPLEVTVAAFGLDAPAQVSMPRADGGAWSATLEPGQTRRLRMTRLAWLRAGAPDRLVLNRDGTDEEAHFEFTEGDRTAVVFGIPRATNVLELEITEQAQSCTVTTTLADGSVQTRTTSAPARGTWMLHSGMVDEGGAQVLLGRYIPDQGWRAASMVVAPGGALLASAAGIDFSEPRFDDLSRMQCQADTSMLQDPQAMAAAGGDIGRMVPFQCTLTRERRTLRDAVETVTRCTAPARMTLHAALLSLPAGERFAPFSGGALDGVSPADLARALSEAMGAPMQPDGN